MRIPPGFERPRTPGNRASDILQPHKTDGRLRGTDVTASESQFPRHEGPRERGSKLRPLVKEAIHNLGVLTNRVQDQLTNVN